MTGTVFRSPTKAGVHLPEPVWAPACAGALPRERESGFTLVELLIALLIFALISAAGVLLLSFSVTAQAAAGERLAEAGAIRRVAAIMAADLGQAAPRISRDGLGTPQPAFVGGSGAAGQVALAFVRRGWTNVDGAPRASLQKVEYRLENGRLLRVAYPAVDGAQPRAPATLLEGVSRVTMRYRSEGEWRDLWDPTDPTRLPQAAEIVLDLEGIGPVRQLFLVGPP